MTTGKYRRLRRTASISLKCMNATTRCMSYQSILVILNVVGCSPSQFVPLPLLTLPLKCKPYAIQSALYSRQQKVWRGTSNVVPVPATLKADTIGQSAARVASSSATQLCTHGLSRNVAALKRHEPTLHSILKCDFRVDQDSPGQCPLLRWPPGWGLGALGRFLEA